MISHDDFRRACDRNRIVLSNLEINRLMNDLFPNPQAGFSVSGFVVEGDEKSIKAVRGWHHDSTAVVPDLRQHARRWMALLSSGRLRVLGSANIPATDPDDWSHFGLEAWSKYPGDHTAGNAAARDLLTAYADGLLK